MPCPSGLRAVAIARWEALSVTPSDYTAWLKAMADDAGVRITHLDPFVRWVYQWRIYYPHSTTALRHKKSSAFEAKGGKGQPTAKLGPTTRPFPRVQRYVSALAAAAELQSEPGLARSG